ncbi:MAG: insulinase family protein [Ginsengibacter sp.]
MKSRLLILVFFLFTNPLISAAQKKYEWKQATSNGYTYKYVSNDPIKARFYTLKNGLSVILTENHKEPRVAVNIAVRAGSNTDPRSHTGLAHYLEHLLFKGTDKFGTLDYAKEKPYLDSITALYEVYDKETDPDVRKKTYHEIDRISGEASKYSIANEYDKMMANLGSQGSNAHTWVEETVYEEDIPSNMMDKFLVIQAERFRKPVLRIFHTELEAVYEEKNRSLDNDGSKVQEKMMYYLFPTHNYGQQTTIGTIEHLKNPSIKAIQAYYDKYYVPNNMSVIMAGDFNPDQLIKKIDENFSYMHSKPVEFYNPAPEKPLTSVVETEVFGPSAESMRIAYRTPGSNTHDALVLSVISRLLSNGSAGIMDIDLNKNQKVQTAGAGMQDYKDYGIFVLYGLPKEGQTLEELKPLLLDQINKIKKGQFDESLLKAIIANSKLSLLKSFDNNGVRLGNLMDAFIKNRGEKWDDDVSMLDQMSRLTKRQIIETANKYFGENYVLVYKRKGEDKNVVKVEKPAITPIETNAGKSSPFVQKIVAMPESNIKPHWVDYEKSIQKSKAGNADVLYIQNKENELFNLYYRFDMGSWNDKELSYAAEYLQFLNTDKLTAEQISKAFYNIACSYHISVSNETTTVSISGLQENFDKAVHLFESLLANCKPNEEALTLLKNRFMKARANNKLNKGSIARGLMSYAEYGPKNPFNTGLSDEQLKNLNATSLVERLHNLDNYKHTIIYYGPMSLPDFTNYMARHHKMPKEFNAYPSAEHFTFQQQQNNTVLFADYDMVQSEIYWIRNIKPYDFSQEATINVFNNYFGGGMGSVVFQTIRESKALAYSTFASYVTPSKKEDPFYTIAYVGSQADKMNEAINGMNELLNKIPVSAQSFSLAKEAVKKDIETQRLVKDQIIFAYLNELKMGRNVDSRKKIYEELPKITMDSIEKLHNADMSSKPYTYCIVGSEKRISDADLEKIGEVKKLSLSEIFGY